MSDFTTLKNKILYCFFLLLFSFNFYGQTLFNENFNGSQFPPEGWSISSTVSGQFTWHNYSSQNSGAVINESLPLNQNEWLLSPNVNLQSYDKLYLELLVRFSSEYSIINSIDFFIKVSTDGGTTWQTIDSDDTMEYNFSSTNKQFTYDVSDFTGQGMGNVKFAVQYLKTGITYQNSSCQIYEMALTECPVPMINGVDGTNLVEWSTPDSFDGTYEIEYGSLGFVQGTGTLITGVMGNTFSFPDIDCNQYDFYIRSNCGNSVSKWTAFRKINIFDLDISESGLLTINGLAENYNIAYRKLTSPGEQPNPFTFINNVAGSTHQLNNLDNCWVYEVLVKSSCFPQDIWRNTTFRPNYTNETQSLPYSHTFQPWVGFCPIGYWTNQINLNNVLLSNGQTYLMIVNKAINQVFSIVQTPKFQFSNNESYTVNFQFKNGGGITTIFDPIGTPVNPISLVVELVDAVTNEVINVGEISGVFNTSTLTTNQFSVTSNFSGLGYLRLTMKKPNSTIIIRSIEILPSPLSLSEVFSEQFKIYPNPVIDMMTVSSETEKLESIEIFDMQGRSIRNIDAKNQREIQVSVQDLPNAIYFVKVKTDKGVKALKVVKG